MAKTFSVDLAAILEKYVEDVDAELKEASEKVAKATVEELKRTSPKRYGKYAASWTETPRVTMLGKVVHVVHVKAPHYRLTHLLEKGHAKRNGGRTRAFRHIKPAEQRAIKEFERDLKERIG